MKSVKKRISDILKECVDDFIQNLQLHRGVSHIESKIIGYDYEANELYFHIKVLDYKVVKDSNFEEVDVNFIEVCYNTCTNEWVETNYDFEGKEI